MIAGRAGDNARVMTPAAFRLAIPLLAALVAACTPFESLWKKPKAGEKPAAEAPEPPPLPLGEATHRFFVAPDQDVVGQVQVTVAKHEDTFADIARRFNVGYTELVRANPGVDPWLPGEGTEIVLPTEFILPDAPREGLVLNLAQMRLYYYPKPKKDAPKDGPVEVVTHPIGIGKVGWATPEGTTKVVSHVKDPTWTPPVSVRKEHAKEGDILPPTVPPGPENPLGRHMMRLGWPSYLIHGTNKPPAVGMRASAGCVRLYPEDIAQIFEAVPDGTKVTVVNQPFLLGWQGDRLLRAGLRAARRRQARLVRRAEGAAAEAQEAEVAALEEGRGARGGDRLGGGCRPPRRSRAASRSRSGRARAATWRRSSRPPRGCATPCPSARPGTGSRTSTPATRASRSPTRNGHDGKHGELKGTFTFVAKPTKVNVAS